MYVKLSKRNAFNCCISEIAPGVLASLLIDHFVRLRFMSYSVSPWEIQLRKSHVIEKIRVIVECLVSCNTSI